MGYVYLFTGTGGGKTTNALGLALRSVGHQHRVVIIQFMKWWKNIGEYKIRNMLAPYYEIHQFGREGWIGLGNLTEEDRTLAKEGLGLAKRIFKEDPPDLLILDEVNLAVYTNLLDVKDVLEVLNHIPKKTDVVLTGRYAPRELIDRAEVVNVIKDVKYPKPPPNKEGIQF